jgi:glycosyltransferase 2 family protein
VLLAVTTVMGVAGLGLLVLSSRSARVRRLVPERLRPAAQTVLATLRAYAASRPLLVRTTLLGLVYQALVVLCTIWLARAIGLDLSAALVAAVLPLVLLATLVPITIAGLGVREGGFVALLAAAGVAAEPATLLSLLSLATAAVASLPGALVLLSWHRRPRAHDYPTP